jgi:hypothetical protein
VFQVRAINRFPERPLDIRARRRGFFSKSIEGIFKRTIVINSFAVDDRDGALDFASLSLLAMLPLKSF